MPRDNELSIIIEFEGFLTRFDLDEILSGIDNIILYEYFSAEQSYS